MDRGKTNEHNSPLAVTLTVTQLREVIRQEVLSVFANHAGTPTKPNKPYLTVKEAADFARIGPSTIRLYIRKRQLRARKVGRRVIVATPDLESFLALNRIDARQ
jgi:excisionase family DNA binding protein